MQPDLTRRSFLTNSVIAGVGLLVLPSLGQEGRTGAGDAAVPGAAAVMANGSVYEVSGHAVPSTVGGRDGIAGVLVSNGRDLARTDASGRYSIEVRDGDVLFVIKPSGWSVPTTDQNLPKFYYVYRPNGSPQYRPAGMKNIELVDPIFFYKGSPPTGPLPQSIDFALTRTPEPDEFKIVCFGDTQVSHDKQIDYMARGTISELVDAEDVAFGISVGDLVNVGLLQLFGPLNEIQAFCGFPWWVLPGNHDQNLLTPSDEFAEEQYRATYGPTVYAFEYGPVSFMMIGNVRREPSTAAVDDEKAKPGTGHPATPPYSIGLRDDQWKFVEQYLASVPKDRQLVIGMHMELSLNWPTNAAYTKRLLSLIDGRPHTLSISGHTHLQNHYFFGPESGFTGPGEHHHFNTICVRGAGYRGMFDELKIPSCQAEDGTPAGYSYITFTKTGYTICYKPSRHPADHQMNIFAPMLVDAKDVHGAKILVNVFAGSKRSTVRMRNNGGEWRPMELKPQADPSLAWVLAQQKKPDTWLGSHYAPGDTPAECSHIWEGTVGEALKPGAHTLEVETVDMFGRRDTKKTIFRVRPDSAKPGTQPAGDLS